MQLKKISFENNEFNNGLKAIEMDRLGQIVAILGSNGAGKTRLLNSVEKILTNDNNFLKVNIADEEKKLADLLGKLLEERKKYNIENMEPNDRNQYLNIVKQYESTEKQLAILKKNEARLFSWYNPLPQKNFTFIRLSLSQQKSGKQNMSFQDTMNQFENLERPAEVGNSVFSFLHHIVKAAFQSKHPEIDKLIIKENLDLFYETQRLIKIMMKMEFNYTVKETEAFPTLNRRELNMDELSSGQRVILTHLGYLLSELLSQRKNGKKITLKGSIIMMDEPELHLHPEALIEMIKHMRKVVGENGQIWMGTHCISLLPHLSTNEIWIMNDGAISPPSIENYHEAVKLLVGSGENFEGLCNFLQEPYEWAILRFATECLMPAEKTGYKKNDPQFFQVSEAINKNLETKKKTIVIDYGAGKGRFAKLLNDNNCQNIEYVPIEPNEECYKEIIKNAASLLSKYGVAKNGNERLVNYACKADVVVLCNVLHEIPPMHWEKELNIIKQLLRPSGSLIICEDQEMPIGELPHKLGFIVLGVEEMQCLFCLEHKLYCIEHPNDKHKSRLLCAEIGRDEINVTQSNVKQSLELLCKRLEESIKKIREESAQKKPTAKEGRKYALYSQMLVNCQFSLENFKGEFVKIKNNNDNRVNHIQRIRIFER